jgi:hypothetical protein
MNNILEKKGPIIKVIGGIPKDHIEKIEQNILRSSTGEETLPSLKEKDKEEVRKLEYPKSSEEMEIIDFANREINKMMAKSEITSRDFPYNNILILPPELYKKAVGEDTDGSAVQLDQVMVLDAEFTRDNPPFFGKLVFHEMMHLKSVFVLEAQKAAEEGLFDVSERRGGLKIKSSHKKNREGHSHEHFRGLNEAIIASEEKNFLDNLIREKMFIKYGEWLGSQAFLEMKKKKAQELGIDEDDVLFIDQDGKNLVKKNYPKQREVYSYILAEIAEEFPEEYNSTLKLKDEFIKSLFTGKLLKIARSTEATFGKGSFRALGIMGKDDNSAIQVLEMLKNMRTQKLRDKHNKRK